MAGLFRDFWLWSGGPQRRHCTDYFRRSISGRGGRRSRVDQRHAVRFRARRHARYLHDFFPAFGRVFLCFAGARLERESMVKERSVVGGMRFRARGGLQVDRPVPVLFLLSGRIIPRSEAGATGYVFVPGVDLHCRYFHHFGSIALATRARLFLRELAPISVRNALCSFQSTGSQSPVPIVMDRMANCYPTYAIYYVAKKLGAGPLLNGDLRAQSGVGLVRPGISFF